MKINYIIKSILFGFLILPLFQTYGQSLDNEKCYQIDWMLTRTYKENSDTLIEPKNPTIEQSPAITADFAKIIPSLHPDDPIQTGQITVKGKTAKEEEIEKLMDLALPEEKTEEYKGTANYTTDETKYRTSVCWNPNISRISREVGVMVLDMLK